MFSTKLCVRERERDTMETYWLLPPSLSNHRCQISRPLDNAEASSMIAYDLHCTDVQYVNQGPHSVGHTEIRQSTRLIIPVKNMDTNSTRHNPLIIQISKPEERFHRFEDDEEDDDRELDEVEVRYRRTSKTSQQKSVWSTWCRARDVSAQGA